MNSKGFRFLFILYIACLAALTSRCSNMQCSNLPQREWPSPSPSPTALPGGVFISPTAPSPTPTPMPEPAQIQEPSMMVFKSTGEKQCQSSGGVSLDAVKAQLIARKIPVFEAHTQADGLMHMALCGTPTGTIHVFMIPVRLRAKALRLGFKPYKPRS
jgi:hypothetical protein